MAQVDKSSVHVKVLDSEAVESKRILLELQLLSLSSLRRLLAIKELREREFKVKKEARLKFQEISRVIKDILEMLPVLEQQEINQGVEGFTIPEHEEIEEEEPPQKETKKKPAKEKKVKKPVKDKKSRLDDELAAIKRQLENFK